MGQRVFVKDIVENFKFQQISGNEESLNREIVIGDVNRSGLELTGYFDFTQFLRVVLLGDKEIGYITNKMDPNSMHSVFDHIMSDKTPCIIISKNHECPQVLKEVAEKKNFPILSSNMNTTRIMTDLVTFLDERLAEVTSLHGVLMSIYGKGILLTGESGTGKSEIALELIKRGHQLVADDRVDVKRVHSEIIGVAPQVLIGMLEIRGIGIIDVTKMFGANSVLDKHSVDYVIHMEKWNENKQYARAGIENKETKNILDVEIPMITLPVKEGRSMAVIIESAVTNFSLMEMGYDSSKEFDERIMNFILSHKEE